MKSGRTIVAAALVAFLGASSSAQKTRSFQNIDLVDVDVVVTDGDGRPVTGLTKEDFDIREDGKPVTLQTFVARTATEAADDDTGRSVVILLDDVTMPRESVNAVKAIATYLAMQARSTDDLSVLRFREPDDEPFGDLEDALARISEYQGALVRYAPAGSPEDVLKLVASVSRKLESTGRRRKILVCIGSPRICSVTRLGQFSGGTFYGDWVDAVGAAARANLSVYALLAVPAASVGRGPRRRSPVERPSGAPATSGPSSIGSGRTPAIITCSGTGRPPRRKNLHSISVKVARKGVHVLARRLRGN